jgi:competence protein ComEC
MKSRVSAFLPLLFFAAICGWPCWGLEPEDGAVFVRIVDTGAALCCVVKTNDGQHLVYDAGHWAADGWRAFNGVQELVPASQPLALMVLSHTDSDHLGGVKRICEGYRIKEIVWPGLYRDTTTWANASGAIRKQRDSEGCRELNLEKDALPATDYHYGDTKISFICGWNWPPSDWPLRMEQDPVPNPGEFYNAGSIVIRLEFAGKSVLFCGDAVGRHKDSPAGTCIATEKYMCDQSTEKRIRSDVIIAAHHGGNNASSERFIQAVDPKWVIFSAGHANHHPTRAAAQRYIDQGVPVTHMLRTDRGDDEPDEPNKEPEWKYGSKPGHHDPPGDDDIDILIRSNGQLVVAYRDPDSKAPTRRFVPEWVLRAEAMTPKELETLDQPKSEPRPTGRHGLLPRLRLRWRG